MSILIFDNSQYVKNYLFLANELCIHFNKVYYVHNPMKVTRLEKSVLRKNLIPIESSYDTYKSDIVSIVDDLHLCVGFNETVSPFVASFSNNKNIKKYCFVENLDLDAIMPKNSLYNFEYSSKAFYWCSCLLSLDKIFFFDDEKLKQFQKMFNRDVNLVDINSYSDIAKLIYLSYTEEL